LEVYQKMIGVPIPDSVQWELVEQVADAAYPIFRALTNLAAQGKLVYQDDTHVRVLSLLKENQEDPNRKRVGMFTTALISHWQDKTISLYFTGRKHAGENFEALMQEREALLEPVIQMCDALAANTSGDFISILCHCLAHARRKFYEIWEDFPEDCSYVIYVFSQVYKHEHLCWKQHLTPIQRLGYHQNNSGPLLEELKEWMKQRIEQHQIEENSSLGKAIKYMRGHWDELTKFLLVPSAPLDNNLAERTLKIAIRNRKNAYFYKNELGALVGDILMSIIHTCHQAKCNPVEYLVTLQENKAAVFKDPRSWLPWCLNSPQNKVVSY
jgi:transposase